jgi:hypothetical protein
MEKNKSIKKKESTVPLDVMIDIAKIIVETEMESAITGLNENKNNIQMIISFPGNLKKKRGACLAPLPVWYTERVQFRTKYTNI